MARIYYHYRHHPRADRACGVANINNMETYRFCALWHAGLGLARTKVLFRPREDHDERNITAYWMDMDVYQAIPLGIKATPDDYRKHGNLDEAENTDIYSNV